MKKKNTSFGGAVAAGTALAGAALGAAAVMFSDKKNQEKIKKTIDELTNEAVVIGKNIKKKADEFAKTKENKEETAMPVVKTTAKKVKSVVKKAAKKIVKKSTPASKK